MLEPRRTSARKLRRAIVTGYALFPSIVLGCNGLVGLRDIEESAPSSQAGGPEASAEGAFGVDPPGPTTPGPDGAADGPSDADPSSDAASTDADVGGDAGDGGCTVIPGLIGWWRGEDNANDAVGGRHGSWTGGAATYAPGKSGKAFAVNTATGGGYVSVPHDATLAVTVPFTISVWVNAEEQSFRAVDKLTNGVNDGYLLDLNGVGGSRFPRLIAGEAYVQSPTSVSANAWHHLVAVGESTTSKRLYVDGVEAIHFTPERNGPFAPDVTLRFGASSDGQNRYRGLVDEVAIFNRALTPAEVATIYARDSESLCR